MSHEAVSKQQFRGLGLPTTEEERTRLLGLPNRELHDEVQKRLGPEHNWWTGVRNLAEGYAIEGPHPQRKGNLPVRLTGQVVRKPVTGRIPTDEVVSHKITHVEVHTGNEWRMIHGEDDER